MEWGPYVDDLEGIKEQTEGRVVPEPLKNRIDIYTHLIDVVNAVNFCESRGYQFSARTPVSEIASYYRNFSTFSGSPIDFLKLYREVEKLRQEHRDKKEPKNDV